MASTVSDTSKASATTKKSDAYSSANNNHALSHTIAELRAGVPAVMGTPLRIGSNVSFIECRGQFTNAVANKHLQTGILKRVVAPNVFELLYENCVVKYKLGELKCNQYMLVSGPEATPEIRVGMSIVRSGMFVVAPAVVIRCLLRPEDSSMYTAYRHPIASESFIWFGRVEQVFVKGASLRVPRDLPATIAEAATRLSTLPPIVNSPTEALESACSSVSLPDAMEISSTLVPSDDGGATNHQQPVDDTHIPEIYHTIGLNRMEMRHAIEIPEANLSLEYLKLIERHIKACVDIVPGDEVVFYTSIDQAARATSETHAAQPRYVVREYCYQEFDLNGARLLLERIDEGSLEWVIALQTCVVAKTMSWPSLTENPPCKTWFRTNTEAAEHYAVREAQKAKASKGNTNTATSAATPTANASASANANHSPSIAAALSSSAPTPGSSATRGAATTTTTSTGTTHTVGSSSLPAIPAILAAVHTPDSKHKTADVIGASASPAPAGYSAHAPYENDSDAGGALAGLPAPGAHIVLDQRAWLVIGYDAGSVLLRQLRLIPNLIVPAAGRTKFDGATTSGKWICISSMTTARLKSTIEKIKSGSLSSTDVFSYKLRNKRPSPDAPSFGQSSTLSRHAVEIVELVKALQNDASARERLLWPVSIVIDSLTGYGHLGDGLPMVIVQHDQHQTVVDMFNACFRPPEASGTNPPSSSSSEPAAKRGRHDQGPQTGGIGTGAPTNAASITSSLVRQPRHKGDGLLHS